MAKIKKRVWRWCAKYIKLRDAINDLPITKDINFVRCRTCSTWLIRNSKDAQASHFISRGLGGNSGVYFDERNIHICCSRCNRFLQGNALAYNDFMLATYGQDTIDQLRWLDKNQSYKYKLVGLEIYYKQRYQELREQIK